MGNADKPELPDSPALQPVFAPAVPEDVRTLLMKHPTVMVPPSQPAPKEPRGLEKVDGDTASGVVIAAAVGIGLWSLLRWIFSAALPDGLAAWLTGIVGAVLGLFVVVGLYVSLFYERPECAAARRWHGQYVATKDWDEEAAAMMLRAQKSVRTIQDSEVNKRGLLDAVKNDVVLPDQLWDLGLVLAQVSVLRTRQKVIGQGLAEPQLDQILGARWKALNLSVAAMGSKVAKLEQYAEQVRNADAVLRAEATAATDTDRYVELLASTEAIAGSDLIDELRLETKGLYAARTAILATALETAHALALPSDPPPAPPSPSSGERPQDREKC